MKKSFKAEDAFTTFDPSEQLRWSEVQIEFLHGKIQDLQRRVQDLLDELEKCGQIVEMTPRELSGKSKL
jgi:hypothetical protein